MICGRKKRSHITNITPPHVKKRGLHVETRISKLTKHRRKQPVRCQVSSPGGEHFDLTFSDKETILMLKKQLKATVPAVPGLQCTKMYQVLPPIGLVDFLRFRINILAAL